MLPPTEVVSNREEHLVDGGVAEVMDPGRVEVRKTSSPPEVLAVPPPECVRYSGSAMAAANAAASSPSRIRRRCEGGMGGGT
jgi:hypothetical protein